MSTEKVIAIVVGIVICCAIWRGCDYQKTTETNAVNNGLTYVSSGWYPKELFTK
jgi:hypothetical protein